jgi:hypothetical protein
MQVGQFADLARVERAALALSLGGLAGVPHEEVGEQRRATSRPSASPATDGPAVPIENAIGGYLFFEGTISSRQSSSARASRPPGWAVPWRYAMAQS